MPLTVRGFFVLNSEKWKSHTPPRRGEGIFLFFPRFFSLSILFFNFFACLFTFFRRLFEKVTFFQFLPPSGGSGGLFFLSLSTHLIYFCIYSSDRHGVPIRPARYAYQTGTVCLSDRHSIPILPNVVSLFSLICSPKERKKKRLLAPSVARGFDSRANASHLRKRAALQSGSERRKSPSGAA